MKVNNKIPELLCPAGSPQAFAAAIEGGADAIYVGGTAFNARINAKNFTSDELRDAISLAHAYGVKVYIATNTLIYDRERDALLRAAEDAYLSGADALIVADLGATARIRERIPIEMHASTQASGHNVEAARRLADLGFSRMVCAREMSRDDLRALAQNSPIETEVFVHGALCVCHSGQCLFSSLVGGRSGNRGECAQPCRLPFRNAGSGEYPLSLKDLSLCQHVPELIEMGIASFKIEGRMKSPEYVRDVCTVWRRLIDERRSADNSELAYLASIFSRGGFTDGYYTKNISSRMLGVRSDADKRATRELVPFDKITRKIPISLSASVRASSPMTLSASDGVHTVTVCGAIPDTAINAPLTKEALERNLTKLGGTPYVAESVEITLDGGLILPVSAINALRREAVSALETKRCANERSAGDFCDAKPSAPTTVSPSDRAGVRSALFYFPERIPDEACGFFDVLFSPIEKYDGRTNGIALPAVIFDSERESVASMIRKARALGCEHILVSNAGHMELARESGMTVHGDFRLNATNTDSALLWEREGVSTLILSPELSLPQIRDITRAAAISRAIVYGRIPLMITEKCVGRELGSCSDCEAGDLSLTDRRGIRFPVLRESEHRSLIVNSLPVYMAERQDELARAGLRGGHFIFTVESSAEISRVIDAYKNKKRADGEVRRIK